MKVLSKKSKTNGNRKKFKRKIGGSFENLPALYAKYHHKCYKKYLSEKCTEPRSESIHNIAFQQLTNYLNPLLEGRALEIPQLLKT